MVRLSVCRLHISHCEVYVYHVGVYISDKHPEDQALFVTERCCFSDLVEGLSSPCPCGLTIKPWALESVMQVRMVIVVVELPVFTVERSCVTCAILLPPLPLGKEDVVEFKSAQ